MHINPDHFLQTASGRVLTPERNQDAWKQSFAALDEALVQATPQTKLFIMIGAQGAGKSSWAENQERQDTSSIIFDAILVKKAERAPLVAAAQRHDIKVVAIWLQTPLHACLSRNLSRPPDEVVPEQAIRNVFSALEPPALEEGFFEIIAVQFVEAGA